MSTQSRVTNSSDYSNTLIVIEAPGKIKLFEKIFLGAQILATKGSLYRYSFDSALNLSKPLESRLVVDQQKIETIKHQIAYCEKLVIATDEDDEGEVIAFDIASLCLRSLPIFRLSTRYLDEVSLKRSFHQSTPFRNKHCAGISRSIIDLIIHKEFGQKGLSIGRVASPLLSVSSETIFKPKPAQNQALNESTWSYRHLLTTECHGITVAEKEILAETLYLEGVASYPRTDNYLPDDLSINKIKTMANNHDLSFTDNTDVNKTGHHAHSCLHLNPAHKDVIHHQFDWYNDDLSVRETMVNMIGRSSLKAIHVPNYHDDDPIVFDESITAQLVELQADNHIGRASTWGGRATLFTEKYQLINKSGLTDKGRASLNKAPLFLRQPESSWLIEKTIKEAVMQNKNIQEVIQQCADNTGFFNTNHYQKSFTNSSASESRSGASSHE